MADLRVKNLGEFVEVVGDKFGNLSIGSGVGDWKTVTIAAAGTVSSSTDLGGNFAYLQVVVPTITSAALELQAGPDGQNFQDLGQDASTTASTGAYADTWVLGGWRYIKVKSSVAQSALVSFKVRGVTY